MPSQSGRGGTGTPPSGRCFGAGAGKAFRPGRYVPFLLPLVLALAVPPITFGADLAARQGLNLTERGQTWATSRRVSAVGQGSSPRRTSASR